MNAMEQSVIGACLLDPKGYWQVADVITEDDFSDERHVDMFRAIAATAQKGHHLDAVSMGDAMPAHGGYAIELANAAVPTNVRFYADRVAAESISRQVRMAGERIAKLATGDSLAEAARMISAIAPHRGSEALPVKAYLQQAVQRMQERCNDPGKIRGVTTGIGSLDDRIGGLEDGTLNILAARPSMGKTALAMQVATQGARQGHVFVASLEMTGEKLSERLISHMSGVSHKLLRTPYKIEEHAWPAIMRATSEAEKLPMTIDEGGSHTIQSICARAQQIHMQHKLRLVVIDHLGLIQRPGRKNTAEEVGDITRDAKSLSKSLGCPVLLLVQLNRKVEDSHDKRPMLSHLRDSGRIEEDADTVLMLYRADYYFADHEPKGIAEILCRKVRDGETGTVYTRANLDCMTFEECDEPAYTESQVEHFASRSTRRFGRNADHKAAASGG